MTVIATGAAPRSLPLPHFGVRPQNPVVDASIGPKNRVRSLVGVQLVHGLGRSVGEIAFYLGTRRTASVVADQDSVVYSLSIDDLMNMEAYAPEVANIFHRVSVFLLSERVMHLTRTVRALEPS